VEGQDEARTHSAQDHSAEDRVRWALGLEVLVDEEGLDEEERD
jgi:hypothetical protein